MIRDRFRRLDSNKLQYLPNNCLNKIPKLMKIKLDKNPWHCDCHSVYLARFLREHFAKLWNGIGGGPICLGPGKWEFPCSFVRWIIRSSHPGELGGKQVKFDLFGFKFWRWINTEICISHVTGQRATLWSSLLWTMALHGELVASTSTQTAYFRRNGDHWTTAREIERQKKHR